ncbi:MAG: NfeD family protein [Oscillospiraceae bacterium]|nr:NfeD family protein [Oscillospiraceae bacterium]
MFGLNGPTVSMAVLWLIAMVVFLIVEGIVPGLVSIWFAIGSLAALLSAALHAPVWLQVVWFLLVSVAALAVTRPLAKKYVNARTQPTNADRIIGKECVVREPIDNLQGTGAVAVDGKVWTARMEEDGLTAREGEVVVARRIEGVKLIVGKL